jgi:hypothetical protein
MIQIAKFQILNLHVTRPQPLNILEFAPRSRSYFQLLRRSYYVLLDSSSQDRRHISLLGLFIRQASHCLAKSPSIVLCKLLIRQVRSALEADVFIPNRLLPIPSQSAILAIAAILGVILVRRQLMRRCHRQSRR